MALKKRRSTVANRKRGSAAGDADAEKETRGNTPAQVGAGLESVVGACIDGVGGFSTPSGLGPGVNRQEAVVGVGYGSTLGSGLDRLPLEVFENICSFLDACDVACLGKSNRQMRVWADEKSLSVWRTQLTKVQLPRNVDTTALFASMSLSMSMPAPIPVTMPTTAADPAVTASAQLSAVSNSSKAQTTGRKDLSPFARFCHPPLPPAVRLLVSEKMVCLLSSTSGCFFCKAAPRAQTVLWSLLAVACSKCMRLHRLHVSCTAPELIKTFVDAVPPLFVHPVKDVNLSALVAIPDFLSWARAMATTDHYISFAKQSAAVLKRQNTRQQLFEIFATVTPVAPTPDTLNACPTFQRLATKPAFSARSLQIARPQLEHEILAFRTSTEAERRRILYVDAVWASVDPDVRSYWRTHHGYPWDTCFFRLYDLVNLIMTRFIKRELLQETLWNTDFPPLMLDDIQGCADLILTPSNIFAQCKATFVAKYPKLVDFFSTFEKKKTRDIIELFASAWLRNLNARLEAEPAEEEPTQKPVTNSGKRPPSEKWVEGDSENSDDDDDTEFMSEDDEIYESDFNESSTVPATSAESSSSVTEDDESLNKPFEQEKTALENELSPKLEALFKNYYIETRVTQLFPTCGARVYNGRLNVSRRGVINFYLRNQKYFDYKNSSIWTANEKKLMKQAANEEKNLARMCVVLD